MRMSGHARSDQPSSAHQKVSRSSQSPARFVAELTLATIRECHMSLRSSFIISLLLAAGCGDTTSTPVPSNSQPGSAPIQTDSTSTSTVSIPADVTYTVIDETKIPGIKRSVDIRLNKHVSEDILTAIAKTVKASDGGTYERTFIGYYLPSMQIDAGYWATSHYNPDLEVRILGLSADAATELSAAPVVPDRDEIGRWLDESPFSSKRIVIYRENGKLFMELTYKDGSSGTNEIIERESPLGRQFSKPGGSRAGDHWVIDSGGDLQLRDQEGLISTAKKLQ